MGVVDALVGGIALPAVTTVAATFLRRAGHPRRNAEDWALAFELLIAGVVLATTLAFQAASEVGDAERAQAGLMTTRITVAFGVALALIFVALGSADWLRGRFDEYEVERLPPGPPTREKVVHLAHEDVRSINIMAMAALISVYPLCTLLPTILAG